MGYRLGRSSLIGLIFGLSALPAYAQDAPAISWYAAGHVDLNVSDPETGLVAGAWQFDRADNGDIRIIKREQRDGTQVTGSLMSICDDQALLFKDIVPPRHREMDELDRPILLLQLTLKLLARGFPQGPLSVLGKSALDVGDEKSTLSVNKGNDARRDFHPPWRVNGVAEPEVSGGIRFKLAFSYAGGGAGHGSSITIDGLWRQTSAMPTLDDAFPIESWRVYRIDTVASFVGGNAQFDPVVISKPLHFENVGELRARIESGWSTSLRANKQSVCK